MNLQAYEELMEEIQTAAGTEAWTVSAVASYRKRLAEVLDPEQLPDALTTLDMLVALDAPRKDPK